MKLFEEFINDKLIYHFTESIDSLSQILFEDRLISGEHSDSRHGRGYENISFTRNPNLWDIEYMGDFDDRYKARITFDYYKMSKEWKFEEFDYGIKEEMEERVVTDEMKGIIKYIIEISISSQESKNEIEDLKIDYPRIKIKIARRKKKKMESY
jgi:hypothetical protein